MRCQDIVSVFKNPMPGHSVLHPGPPNAWVVPDAWNKDLPWNKAIHCVWVGISGELPEQFFLVYSLPSPFLPSLSLPLPFFPPSSLLPCVVPLPPLTLSLSLFQATVTQWHNSFGSLPSSFWTHPWLAIQSRCPSPTVLPLTSNSNTCPNLGRPLSFLGLNILSRVSRRCNCS